MRSISRKVGVSGARIFIGIFFLPYIRPERPAYDGV